MPKATIPIPLAGGMANAVTPLRLFLQQKGDLEKLINADTSIFGEIRLLRPLKALNATAENFSVHSVFIANDVILAGIAENLKYWDNDSITSLLTTLGNDSPLSFAHAGKWVFMCNGSAKKSVYLPGGETTPTGCDWGLSVPSEAPIVSVGSSGGSVGSSGGTEYSCYYRYKITMPDGSIIRTGLSPVATITVDSDDSESIEWTIIHASFEGATTVQAELFRTSTGWDDTYLVTTLTTGTTTYSDNNSDATVQANDAFDETGYYPPVDSPDLCAYHPGSDRVFIASGNSAYWSEAGLYHIFVYNSTSGTYTNTNDVFLSGENINAMIILDEQMYFGSQKGWRRLRGADPDTWRFEDTSAIKGPVSKRACSKTLWGMVYPGNDGRLWLFNGFEARPILEHFIFDTKPSYLSHSTFDGRFYRLFYKDPTYPSAVIDFFGYPSIQPRVVKSTQSAESSFYDVDGEIFVIGTSDGYIKTGEDTDTSITLTIKTPEIPVEALDKFGDMATLVMRVNSQGSNVTVTTYCDGVARNSGTAFSTSTYAFYPVPIPLDMSYTLQFEIEITSKEEIRIGEPLVLSKTDV